MEEIKKCPNCGVLKAGHVIKIVSIKDRRCVVCGLPVPAFVPMPHSIKSDIGRAKSYLKETGMTMTPDAVRDALWAGTPAISPEPRLAVNSVKPPPRESW